MNDHLAADEHDRSDADRAETGHRRGAVSNRDDRADADRSGDVSGREAPDALERRERFRDAAIDVELATGEREPTRRAAWRQVVVRMVRMGVGLGVVGLGVVMLPLPGPGMLVIAVGLAILSRDVAWADRLLGKVRERLPSDADGKLPRSTIATIILLALAGIAVSIWLTVGDINPLDYMLFWRD